MHSACDKHVGLGLNTSNYDGKTSSVTDHLFEIASGRCNTGNVKHDVAETVVNLHPDMNFQVVQTCLNLYCSDVSALEQGKFVQYSLSSQMAAHASVGTASTAQHDSAGSQPRSSGDKEDC